MVSTHGESIRSVTAADMHANFSCLAHPLISWTGPRIQEEKGSPYHQSYRGTIRRHSACFQRL